MLRNGTQGKLDKAALEMLQSRLQGPLIQPGDDGYEEARHLWNGMIDRRPALIARCTDTADVIHAVKFVRNHDLLLAVRSSGHGVAGHAVCDGGLVVDLSLMKEIRLDPEARTARIQPGVNWGELDRQTQVHGLATPGGIVSDTGIAGLTLGGGFGWLSRAYGLTCDNLLSAEVVTADGRLLRTSATENANLFWGLRGGGGNFGVVTSFRFQLHAVGPTVMAGIALYPMAAAPELLRFLRSYAVDAPDELTVMATLRLAPPSPDFPTDIHGQPVVSISLCYAGSVEEGWRVVQPVRAFGQPLVDLIGPQPYLAFQSMLDAGVPRGRQYYWKSAYLPDLSDQALETMTTHAAHITSPYSQTTFFQLGGAISRLGDGDSAYGHRQAQWIHVIASAWDDPLAADRHIGWTREFWQAMRPFSLGGGYVNFLSDDAGQDRVQAAYNTNHDRLVTLKNRYDPSNLFQLNHNIQPTV
jgi:FAD/FMN-containing dehydrogenase